MLVCLCDQLGERQVTDISQLRVTPGFNPVTPSFMLMSVPRDNIANLYNLICIFAVNLRDFHMQISIAHIFFGEFD